MAWRLPDANKIPTGGKDGVGNNTARQMIAFNDRTRLTGQLTPEISKQESGERVF